MPVEPEKQSDFNPYIYLGMLQKRKYLALSVSLAVLSICTWGSFFWPRSFEAKSIVFVQRSAMLSPLLKGVGVTNSIEERLRTLKESMLSRNLIERVIKKLDLDVYAKNPTKYENLIEDIRKRLTITIKGSKEEADLFTISYTGPKPVVARDIVNTLVSEYIGENLGYRRTDAYGAFEFIQNQLSEYKTKLEESDKALREFREKNPRLVPQSEGALLSRVENFQNAKIEADIKIKELSRKRESLEKQLSGEKELTVAMVTREGSPQSRLSFLNNQYVLLMSRFTEKHPEIIKIKGEMEELKRQIAQARDQRSESAGSETSTLNPIYQQLREELARTNAEIETLRGRSGELSRQQQEAQGILGRMPKEQEEWAKLQRDRNVYNKLYDELLQRLETARVSKDIELTDKSETFKIVDPAVTPVLPAKPNRIKIIMAGLILGIASGIGAVVGIESLNKSFKDEDSVETVLKLPVLASIQNIIVADAGILAAKKLDKKIFIAVGVYLFIILLILIREILFRNMGIYIGKF